MPASNIFIALALVALASAPAAAHADAPSGRSPPCVFREYPAVSVESYVTVERIGRGSIRRLKGAQVYVRAEPGLTAAWLWRRVEQQLAKIPNPAERGSCVFGMRGVRVEVLSAGPGFWVRLSASDSSQATEVLRRARLLPNEATR